MTTFQAGDEVTAHDFGLLGIVLDPEPNAEGRVKVNWRGGAVSWALESALIPFPEPATRDVELRVVVPNVGSHDRDSAVADDLRMLIDDGWTAVDGVTVEVVE